MDLDTRLQKLATGLNVADAIESYMASLPPDARPDDPSVEEREESEAIVEIMFLMAAVDGNVSREELAQLSASIEAIAHMGAIRGMEIDSTLKQMSDRLDAEGWAHRLRDAAARVRAPDAREFAFRLAAGVAFVDDFVPHAEAAAIDSLASAFDLDAHTSQAILREVHETLFGE